MNSIIQKFTPVTDCIGLIEANLTEVIRNIEPIWFRMIRLVLGQPSFRKEKEGGLTEALSELSILDRVGFRIVVLELLDGRAVLFRNAIDRGALRKILSELSVALRTRAYVFRIEDEVEELTSFQRSPWGYYGFSMYDGCAPGSDPTRLVAYTQDYGEWDLQEHGKVRDFERDIDYASARTRKERRERITRAANGLELDYCNLVPAHFSHRYAIYKSLPLYPVRKIPLVDARQELGLE